MEKFFFYSSYCFFLEKASKPVVSRRKITKLTRRVFLCETLFKKWFCVQADRSCVKEVVCVVSNFSCCKPLVVATKVG